MKAAIFTEIGAPLEIADIEHETIGQSATCGPLQVRVAVSVSGICGAQLMEISGNKNGDAPLPRLLGHEAAGVIKEVGVGVNVQLIGRKVCMHWRPGDGQQAFLPARYQYKNRSISGGHIVTFAESVVVSANRVTPVDNDIPDELCTLMGCGLSTALGTIEQEAKLKFGESCLIVGCGGVGLNLIMAAELAGAHPLVGMDIHGEKFESVMQLGATQFVGGVHELTVLEKFDVIVDTTGVASVIEQTIPLLSGKGRYVMLGQTKPGESFRVMSAVDRFHGQGSHIIWSQGGGFKPTEMIPRYCQLWRGGYLNLDGIISHRLPLNEINAGIELVKNGQAGRVLLSCKS